MFQNIMRTVKNILLEDKKSRSSDKWLYSVMIERGDNDGLTSRERRRLVYLIRKGKLPNFATVMRSRQYVQSQSPELTERITARQRAELEEIYRLEFRGK